MKRRHLLVALGLALASASLTLLADEPSPQDAKNLAFRNEVRGTLDRGLAWLETQQNRDGSFGSDEAYPALAATPIIAFQRQPTGDYLTGPKADFLEKSYRYLRSFAQPDGGIYNPENGRGNYNTSASLMALLNAVGQDPELLLKARAYVVRQQAFGMEKPEADGGIGHGQTGTSPTLNRTDLDDTLVALEALRYSADLAKESPGEKDIDWAAAIGFVGRCQNLPGYNQLPWASDDAANRGGFVFFPGFSSAGVMNLEGGRQAWRSYGTMSYAGLLSFAYGGVKKDDPRMQAAIGWLSRHYTLAENPGFEKTGYYYYLYLMAKALTAAKVTELEVGGRKVDWRKDLALQLMKLQTANGSWANEAPRWKETNRTFVTGYCVIALELIYNQL